MGGGFAAGRHPAIPGGAGASVPRPVLECNSCGRPVTTPVAQLGRLFCSWDCVGSAEAMVPGHYLG
jgi:hypothetical protein